MGESDVVVVGSGAAALSAALTVAVGGVSVTVLERASVFGGTSAVSGGGMWLPGNTLDPDFTDDLAGAKRYLQRLTLGLIPEAVLDRFLEVAGAIPDFFSAHTPLIFSAELGRPDYHAPLDGSSLTSRTVFPHLYDLPRLGELSKKIRRPGPGGITPIQHFEEPLVPSMGRKALEELIAKRLAEDVCSRGLALVGGLTEGALAAGAEFLSDTRARSLIVEGGRVVGVVADHDGQDIEYRARLGVVLASGGFEWNQELWQAFVAVPWDNPASPPGNEGDGLIMAARVGAKLANLDKVTWIQTRYVGDEYFGRPYVRMASSGGNAGEIMVNLAGRRFANENLNYNDIGRPLTYFDPHNYEYVNYPAYAIGDKAGLARAATIPKHLRGPSPDAPAEEVGGDGYAQADTLRELAEKVGIDPDGLERQVKEWNENSVDGIDPAFHRGEKPWETHSRPDHKVIAPILEPPFYAYRVRSSQFGTRGGPVIDENAQVLDWDDEPIPGLYGAGNVVANPFASSYPGGGGTLGPAVVFGHVAGKSILASR